MEGAMVDVPQTAPSGLQPTPPSEPRSALSVPAKMAMVTLLPLNSFAVTVNWTPPADVFSRKSRSALALARGKSVSGNLIGETCPDLPVVGYRLRYWSVVSQEDSRFLEEHYDVGKACRQMKGEPEVLPETWGPEQSSAVLKWLVPGNTYVFQAMAFNSVGDGEWSEASKPFLMPERPDGLGMNEEDEAESGLESRLAELKGRPAHLSKSIDAIEIAWNKPCDRGCEIETYEFLISQDPKFPKHDTRQINVDGTSASLQLDGLTPNQVYYVKHRAHNQRGPSSWSETTLGIATRSRPPERPDAPVRVDTPTKPHEVVIRWTHPECYNIPVQHYQVRSSMTADMSNPVEVSVGNKKTTGQRGELMEEEGPQLSPTSAQKRLARGSFALTQMKIKGLRPSTIYYFQVRACNQIGSSDWSVPSMPMKMGSCHPARCERPRFLSGNVNEGMKIYWQVPDTYGEGEVTRYDVRFSTHALMKEHRLVEDVKFKRAEVLAMPAENLAQTVVTSCWGPTIDQFFQVRAWSAAGMGQWSASSEAMQVDPVRPAQPQPPERFDLLPRSVVVHWKASESYGCQIVGFALRYAESRDMSRSCEVTGIKGDASSFPVTSLRPAQTYYFQVRCINLMGTSDWSDPSMPVKIKQDVPCKMSAPVLIEKSAKHVNVSFQPPADFGTFDGDLVTGYSIFYACGPDCVNLLERVKELAEESAEVKVIRGVRSSSTVISDLRPGSDIAVQVFGSNSFGDGPLSNVALFRTLPSEPEAPMAPSSNVTERTSWSTFISVFPCYDGGCPVTKFGFEVKDVHDGSLMQTPIWGTNAPDEKGYYFYSINTLRPGHTYQFRAFAVNEVGPSEWSQWSEEMETLPWSPEPPTDPPQLSDPDAYSFTANWDDIDGNGSPVTDWLVQWSVDREFSSKNSIKEAKVHGARTVRCNRCLPGLTLHCRVAGINGEGQSHFGPVASIKTLYDRPVQCAPPHVTHTAITGLRLSWMHPHNGGSELTNFWLRWWETDAGGRPESIRDCGEMIVKGKRRFILVDGLQARRTYQFQLAAENKMGLGEYSEPSKPARTLEPAVPEKPGKPIGIRCSFNTITMIWTASESIGAECTGQVVQISHDPTFPPSLTGQAWLPPYREKRRRDITTDVTFRTPQAFQAGPEKRPGWKDDQTASLTPKRDSMSYGRVSISRSTWTPPKEMEGVHDDSVVALWQKEVFESIFAAETAARISSAMVESMVNEQLEIMGHTTPRFSQYPEMKEAMKKPLTKEELEEKRKTMRRGVYTGQPGFKSLVDQLRESNATPTPPTNANKYNLVGMQPGTYYYARVASVNEMGLSHWSPVSLPCPSGAYPPAEIPQDPGIELLRVGCTSLSFGWTRPYCGGAPVTHYVVRFAESAAALQEDDCYEFSLDETEIETWPGMVHEEAVHTQNQKPNLENEEVISTFAEYLMTRFGGVEESWEWLDINGNGEVSREEFIQGDLDTGPPFIDFCRPEWLDQVWDLLDRDRTNSISINEYTRLRPYMEAVKRGQAGMRYDGFYCMVPSLTPGKSYYIMARPCNRVGTAGWTKCLVDPITTLATTPPRMEAIESVPEQRTAQTICLRWKVPWGNGDTIRKIEILWMFQDLEDGNVEYQTLIRNGKKEVFEQDPDTGEIQTEFLLPKLQPGQIVAAVARPFNGIGGARLWSPMPGPGQGKFQDLWTWDICTIATEADIPGTVFIDEPSLKSQDYLSHGEFSFEIGARTNGRHILFFEFRILDEKLEVFQEFRMEVTPEESLRLRKSANKWVRGSFQNLLPGELYCLQVRVINAVGPSTWAEPGPFARMPPDVPKVPEPLNSELTSLEFIEVKWKPPHESGADIEKYEIRMAMRPNPIEEEWITIDEDDLEKNTKIQGEGKKLTSRDKGSYAYRIHGLEDGTMYYFTIRACNCVGWSGWSEVARFSTKNSKPAKLEELWMSSVTSRDISVAWTAPETNGVELLRVDLIAGPNESVVRWCQFASRLMDHTDDVDKLFGYAIKEDAEPDVGAGCGSFGELYCEECMYAPVVPPKQSFTITSLLPGQDYFFMARAVGTSGKGEFSQVLGPLRTESEGPKEAETMELHDLEIFSCSASFRLPYNFGSPIDQIHAVLRRLEGPLSLDELDETGEVQVHVAGQEQLGDPLQMVFQTMSADQGGTVREGVTRALRRCFAAEGLAEDLPRRISRTSTPSACTGQSYKVHFEGLRPGTTYEITWCCQNGVGRSPQSGPLVLTTHPAEPDQPPPVAVDSL